MSKSKTIPYLEKLLAKAADVANLIKIDENGNVNVSAENRKKIVEAGGDLLHKVIVMKSREKLDEMDNEDDLGDDESETSAFDDEGEDEDYGGDDETADDIDTLRNATKSEDEGIGASSDGEIAFEDDEPGVDDSDEEGSTLGSSDFAEIQKMLDGDDEDMDLDGEEEPSDDEDMDLDGEEEPSDDEDMDLDGEEEPSDDEDMEDDLGGDEEDAGDDDLGDIDEEPSDEEEM